jgi:hypothetical protein
MIDSAVRIAFLGIPERPCRLLSCSFAPGCLDRSRGTGAGMARKQRRFPKAEVARYKTIIEQGGIKAE